MGPAMAKILIRLKYLIKCCVKLAINVYRF